MVLGDGVASVQEDSLTLSSGRQIPTYTSIWTAGVQANTDASEFGIEKARAGRLVANEFMEAKGKENVYVAGDLVYFEESEGNQLHRLYKRLNRQVILRQVILLQRIKGGEKHSYKGKYDGFMVSIGARYGVAFLMDKYHMSGFMAMAVKHMVNLLYFFTIRSFFYMGSYVRHEFFGIQNKRNILAVILQAKEIFSGLCQCVSFMVQYGSTKVSRKLLVYLEQHHGLGIKLSSHSLG